MESGSVMSRVVTVDENGPDVRLSWMDWKAPLIYVWSGERRKSRSGRLRVGELGSALQVNANIDRTFSKSCTE